MAFDDPIVWILIIAVVVFLFGATKIPSLARSIGQARREFDKGWKGGTDSTGGSVPSPAVQGGANNSSSAISTNNEDPLILAAQREGIDTQGKTKEQIASELSWKLNKK